MDGSEDAAWPTAWLRASLELAILGSLVAGPRHGYGIAETLAGHGMGRPRGGSLYPALGRLEEAGAVTATWQPGDRGPGRRSYTLTALGRGELAEGLARWRGLGDALEALSTTARADEGGRAHGRQHEKSEDDRA